ncbi:MAG: hypothetical protein INR71_04185 [Terriglobus roseus]|nr:hypothetical protein [Terriglobus roseus]
MEAQQQQTTPGGWDWPNDIGDTGKQPERPSAASTEPAQAHNDGPQADQAPPPSSTGQRRRNTHWRPRTCRICLETVQPTFHPPPEGGISNLFQAAPEVTYESEDGRLIRPCKCKGSQRYVHEKCLEAWRHADPTYGRRNFWQCPTCKFKYRLDRMSWGRIISSTATQLVLTVSILLVIVFVLGFAGDYVLDLYLDPWSTLSPFSSRPVYAPYDADDVSPWAEHFLKGFTSLGLLSFSQALWAPGRFFVRIGGGGGGGRAGRTGRDRLSDATWLMILIGVATCLWVRARLPKRRLKANETTVCVESHSGHYSALSNQGRGARLGRPR